MANEAFMPRNIHKTDRLPATHIEGCKSQFDGDAPLLFLQQAVSLDTGEGTYQRRLAMVNMPGGADDAVVHGQAEAAQERPRPASSSS